MNILTLDGKGVALAFLMAGVMLLLGYLSGGGLPLGVFFVVSMLYFLALSAIATRAGMAYKKRIRQYQKVRGVRNVLANGMGPLVFAVVVFYFSWHNEVVPAVVGFISSVAAVTSDKFSSEIGILDGTPTSIVTFRKVKRGESGGVTLLGLTSGLFGAFIVSLILGLGYLLWFSVSLAGGSSTGNGICIGVCDLAIGHNLVLAMVVIGTLAGFIGTLVDSVLGHYEERGMGNKYTSNFLCSIVGGLAGILLYALIVGF